MQDSSGPVRGRRWTAWLSRTIEPGALTTVMTAALWAAVVAGTVLGVCTWNLAQFPDVMRYTFGDRAIPTPPDHLVGPLLADVGVIAGYVLVLGSCALIIARLATTTTGTRFGRMAWGCVFIGAIADVAEDVGLYVSTFYQGPEQEGFAEFVTTATAAAATLKWSVLTIALLALPAAIVVLWIRWRSRRQLKLSQRNLEDLSRDMSENNAQPEAEQFSVAPPSPAHVNEWWNECRQETSAPVIADEHMRFDNWSWNSAYDVPGAEDVISRRAGRPVHAICLSGGGVRSASVAMGALQVLSRAAADVPNAAEAGGEKFIDTVDYIISVSGGGYTAGARLLACKKEPDEAAERGVAVTPTETLRDRPIRVSERFAEGSVEFEHVRRHSSYIADSLPTLLRALGYVFRNLLASVVILFWLPVALGLAIGYLYAYLPIAAIVPVIRYDDRHRPLPLTESFITEQPGYFQSLIDHPYAWWALGIFAATSLALLAAALCIEVNSFSEAKEALRNRLLVRMNGVMLVGIAVGVLLVGLPALMRLCVSTVGTDFTSGQIGSAVASVLGLQYLSALAAMVWRRRARLPLGGSNGKRSWRTLLPPGVVPYLLTLVTLAVLTIAWLAVLGSVAAGVFGYLTQGVAAPYRQIAWLPWWLLGTAVVIGMLCFADVTSLSLHPFYRWRLANTFAVRRSFKNVAGGALPREPYARIYPAAEPTWLHTHGAVAGGPKFVFAAAAAISGEGKPAPGLNAVSFVMSSDYIGGPELGWLKTPQIWAACPPRLKRDLTVQAAVAVSGAAFASAMGRQNKGFQALLAVSGARLGTWLPNPRHVATLCDRFPIMPAGEPPRGRELLKALPAVRGFTYFYRELFASNSKDARLVQVTDGGHYENLGLVEALRRRARVIVCIDGGGDPPPLLSGLADAMRLAKSELGVEFTLDETGPFAVQNLTPGGGKPFPAGDAFALLNSRITKGTVVRGRILYPAASGLPTEKREGLLILAKAVVWEGAPDWLLTYAGNSAIFPHDSTSDQWFTEAQFAAYTELGRILGRSVVDAYNDSAEPGTLRQRLDLPGG